MREVVEILNTMGPEQLFLALVYLGCHTRIELRPQVSAIQLLADQGPTARSPGHGDLRVRRDQQQQPVA